MARAITKVFGSSQTKAIVKYFNDGKIEEREFLFDGNKSERAIQALVFKKLNTRNFMLVSHGNIAGTEEATYTMSADDFMLFSNPCDDGVSYGHDTVTSTFKNTYATYYTSDMEEHTFFYVGVTTESKLRKAIIEEIKDSNILVGNIKVLEERRYMSKDKFMQYARKA